MNAFGSGCALDTEQHKELLLAEDVKKALGNASVHLEECYRINSEDFILNGVAPTIWEVARNRDDHVFIYIFDNFKDRKKAEQQYWENREKLRYEMKPYLGENLPPMYYKAKNALVVYLIKDEHYYPKPFPREIYLTSLAISNLKEIEKLIFTGESEHWIGKITVRQFEYILTADKKILSVERWINAGMPKKEDYESGHLVSPQLTYKKADITNINEVSYRVLEPRGHFEATERLNNRSVGSGSSGGSGLGANKDDVFLITVRWNGNEEVMELRAK